MQTEKERRALMRRIWRLNLESDEGRYRIERFGQPWLVENFYDPALAHLPQHELRITFPDRRKAADIPLWERAQRFRQSIPYLYHQARLAREKGMSWRDFKVGTALLAFKSGQRHDEAWKTFSGMNTKHAPNMRPTCSEPIAINGAYAEDYSLVIGMVVVGELREEDIGHILTLHPCRDCRWFMNQHPLIDRHTLVLTVQPNFWGFGYWKDRPSRFQNPYELRTVGQLLELHRRISGDDFS
ncbi:MAG TPA: hypothetical protein VHD38_02495 [Candidatus Paceibacterota bacterium]|nr:hypothetical protein [Candidatus Paceibacterota bacterium]